MILANRQGFQFGTFSPSLCLVTHRGDKRVKGLYQDAACTTPATAQGHPVGGWRDETTGLVLKLTQGTSGARPILNFENGTPTILTDGSDDFFDVPNLALATGAELFMASRVVNDYRGYPSYDLGAPTTDDRGSYVPYFDGSCYDSFATTVRKTYGQGALPNFTWRVYNARSENGLFRAYSGNTQLFTTASNVFVAPNNATLGKAIGGYQASAFVAFIIGKPVADVSRNRIANYLSTLFPV